MDNRTTETYIKIKQVAQLCGVSTRTIRRYVDDGIIPCHRITSRTVRYRLSEVEAALTGSKRR